MPSANYVMKNWRINITWTPDPALYAARTVTLKFKAHATNGAYVTQMAQNAVQDMTLTNPVTIGSPSLDPDQSW